MGGEIERVDEALEAARAVGGRIPGALAGPVAPLRLVNRTEPKVPSISVPVAARKRAASAPMRPWAAPPLRR